MGEYLAKLEARAWLSRALVRLANTLLKDGESARNNHVAVLLTLMFHKVVYQHMQGAVGFLIPI